MALRVCIASGFYLFGREIRNGLIEAAKVIKRGSISFPKVNE